MIFASMILTILIFLILLSVLVFVHELGHFLVARKTGMAVEEFGFGFPPRMAGFRRGGVLYSVNWIPIGGFVKIKGEDGSSKSEDDSFAAKKPWQRFLVLIAGVVMNFLFAAFLFSIGYMSGLPTAIEGTLPKQAVVREQKISIMQVLPNSPAARAGIVSGDVLVSLNGAPVSDASSVRSVILEHQDGVKLMVQKKEGGFQEVTLVSEDLPSVKTKGIGVGFLETGLVSYPWYLAVPQGFVATARLTQDIFVSLGLMIKNIFSEQKVAMDLAGPVGIAVMTKEVAAQGWIYLLQFAALLSVNLAVVNILPFPALDGGRVLLLIIEKIRGKSVQASVETVIHNIGFICLMALVVFVTYRDLVRLSGAFIGAIK